MIHVISDQIYAAAQLCQGHGSDVFCRRNGAPVVSHLKSSAKFCGQIRKCSYIVCNIVHDIVITSDIGVISIAAEYIVFIWSKFFRTLFPWGFTVASHYGEKSSGGSTAPSGSGIERCDQAYLFGYFRQPFHVIIPFFTL